MYLHTIKTSLVAQICNLAPVLYEILDLWNRESTRLVELVARPLDLELDVAGADGVRIECSATLSTWVRELGNEEGTMGLRELRNLAEGLNAVVVVVA